ncbi:MAG: ThiF family adenylyltransferase [Cyclobacteriaceae bacterium]
MVSGYLWHEDKNLSNLFESEIQVLKNGLNGDFDLEEIQDPKSTGGVLIAIGRLKYGKSKEHHIIITFPTKYPFSPPKIIPVLVDEKDGFKQYRDRGFRKGNQYNDGEMCLLQKEAWEPFINNVGWALRKAQEWLSYADSTTGFPKDKIVEEVPMLFPHQGQVILPKEFIPDKNLNKGQITLTQFKPEHYILQRNLIDTNIFKVTFKDDIFKWFKFPDGIKLSSLVPNYNIEHIARSLISYFGEDILTPGLHNIAFYLPGDNMHWHFFKIQILANGSAAMSYLISHVVEDELYLRTKDIIDNKILLKKRVTIIGLGAIGSEVSISLAKNGLGVFHLFDKDTFEIGNSVRHAANILYIGEKKSQVCKQLIQKINPNIIANDHHLDVLNDQGLLEVSLKNSDLCIVLTGEDSVDFMINDLYVNSYNIPFIFAGVSIGAFSGGVEVINQNSGCLRCISLWGEQNFPKTKSDLKLKKLPPEYGNCSGPALPGSEIDIKEISLQVTRIAIQLLLGQNGGYSDETFNLYRWHGPFGSKDKPKFHWDMKNIDKHPDCRICQ